MKLQRVSSEDCRTPFRGQAVKQSAELQSALEFFATAHSFRVRTLESERVQRVSSEDRKSPVRGQAVSQSAEMRSAMEFFAPTPPHNIVTDSQFQRMVTLHEQEQADCRALQEPRLQRHSRQLRMASTWTRSGATACTNRLPGMFNDFDGL